MAQPSKAVRKACRVLRYRVRFESAFLQLPCTSSPGDDTKEIREATRLYMESWVVPILDMIESGDTKAMQSFCENESGHPPHPSTPKGS
jgi:ubiquinone/menaquinone biosynthesis C-methylase UbiE